MFVNRKVNKHCRIMNCIEEESTTDAYNKIDDCHMYYADREKTFTN